jgi:hypothetical protein
MVRLVYEVRSAIPEGNLARGDVIIITPGQPIIIARERDCAQTLASLAQHGGSVTLMLCEGAAPPMSPAQLGRWLRDNRDSKQVVLRAV